ncbi:MAG: hypothetical protein CL582_17835 [Alteromonadaceae bacterium]|nr:hypothetical protein [Alteromonadaceae bacterium]|tara:strand:- start:283 stop:1068 length:786 start_codon:yes stop_codon:yes gene_type:complete
MLKKSLFLDEELTLEGLFAKKKESMPSEAAFNLANRKSDFRDLDLSRMDREVDKLESDFIDVLKSIDIDIDIDDVIESLTREVKSGLSSYIPNRSDRNLRSYITFSILMNTDAIGQQSILSDLLVVADVNASDKRPGEVLYSNDSFVLTYHQHGDQLVYKLISTYMFERSGEYGDHTPIVDAISKKIGVTVTGGMTTVDDPDSIQRRFDVETLVEDFYKDIDGFAFYHVGDIGDYTAIFNRKDGWVVANFNYDDATWVFNV